MKKYKDLKAVCFVDSTYTMLIYMLAVSYTHLTLPTIA